MNRRPEAEGVKPEHREAFESAAARVRAAWGPELLARLRAHAEARSKHEPLKMSEGGDEGRS